MSLIPTLKIYLKRFVNNQIHKHISVVFKRQADKNFSANTSRFLITVQKMFVRSTEFPNRSIVPQVLDDMSWSNFPGVVHLFLKGVPTLGLYLL